MKILTATERRALRARAHDLSPLVRIAEKGLTAAVISEIERSLAAHELLKIRLFDADRAARDVMFAEICTAVGACPVQHIGKLLVIWREKPEETALPVTPPPRRRGAPRLTKKAQAEASTRPAPRKRTVTKRT